MDRRKLNSNICIGLFFFLSGVEYTVILPTLNGYLITLGAEQHFLGIVMTALYFGVLVSAPVYGRIADKTKSTKTCLMMSNCFEIIGNIMYFTSTDKYMVLGARFISGIGTGVQSSVFGMLTRTTTEEERTGIFSLLLSLRPIGRVVGPAFNLFLHSVNFQIGDCNINEYTSPGFIMAIAWTVHTLLVMAVYKNMEQNPLRTDCDRANDEIADDETLSSSRSTNNMIEKLQTPTIVKEFLRDEVVVCLAISFIVALSQTGMETMIAPLTLFFFEWDGLQNSYLFSASSLVVIMSYVAIRFLSNRFYDRLIVLWGAIGMAIAYVLILVCCTILAVSRSSSTPNWMLPIFITVVAILSISMPLFWVPHVALFSKITSPQTQAFNQSVRLVSYQFGTILGPIWASYLVTLERFPILFGVHLFLFLMVTTMIVFSYDRLKPNDSFLSRS